MKEQVACADTKKADYAKLLGGACEESEQQMVRLNVPIVGLNLAEKLTHALVTESVSAINAVFQQFDDDAVSRLRGRLERAYSAVRVPCLAALTLVSGGAATSTC